MYSGLEIVLGAEEIQGEIPRLTLAQVYAALAYHHANREEIDTAIASDDAEAEGLESEHRQRA